jgi:hypothetical protein
MKRHPRSRARIAPTRRGNTVSHQVIQRHESIVGPPAPNRNVCCKAWGPPDVAMGPKRLGGSTRSEFGRLLALLDRTINRRRLRRTVSWRQVKRGSEAVFSRARILDALHLTRRRSMKEKPGGGGEGKPRAGGPRELRGVPQVWGGGAAFEGWSARHKRRTPSCRGRRNGVTGGMP